MTPLQLRSIIQKLPEAVPVTDAFEAKGCPQSSCLNSTWYKNQKEHWLAWLGEYHGPGAYGRKDADRNAQFIYNHFQCPPGLLWLAEASGIDEELLNSGCDAIQKAQNNPASQCAAFRKIISWEGLEVALNQRQHSRQKVRGLLENTKSSFGHALFQLLSLLRR